MSKISLLSLTALSLVACGSQVSNQQTTSQVDTTSQSNQTSSAISQDEAKAKALEMAGASEADVSNLTVKQDTEQGQLVYEVDFDYNGVEYSYTIDAQTGAVTEQEREQAEAQATTNLTADDAKAVAFADFENAYGAGESDVTNLTVKQDTDNAQVVYEIDFDYNGYEYSYDINAETGAIVGFDQDLID